MKHYCNFFLLFLLFPTIKMNAQFNTVYGKPSTLKYSHLFKSHDKAQPQSETAPAPKENLEEPKASIDTLKTKTIQLLQSRLNVCLPLKSISINSPYGKRVDPITKKQSFHDGIDLKCSYEAVYSMLPAKVKKTHHGKRGYGNYIILDHGEIECLYGHLSKILVKEGDIVGAGKLVAISGNTGKSTGAHLHLRLRQKKESVNPQPFLLFLQNYIKELDYSISPSPTDSTKVSPLTISKLYASIKKHNILFPTIVLSQAILETGYFSSNIFYKNNNLFGLRKPSSGEYYKFSSWEDSVRAYKEYVQYKYKDGNYYKFLEKIGYAEDPDYTKKVQSIQNTIQPLIN